MDRPDDIATTEPQETRERADARPAVPRPPGEAPAPEKTPATAPSSPASPPRRRRSGFGWLVTLLLIAGLGWVAWRVVWPRLEASRTASQEGRRGGGAGAPPQPVGVATIGTGDMNVVLTGIGTVTSLSTVTVQTQINGQLVAVGFQEGQIVKKGDFLAQIDPRPYEISLAQAQGALAHDTGLLNQAKSDLQRYTLLNRQDSIAKQQYADQEFVVEQDQGLIAEDQASIESAKLNIAYCHIVSPVTGRVGLRLVDPGNYVQAASATGLVVVVQLDPISVIFTLPEDDIPEVLRQSRGKALPVDAYDRTNATRLATGTLATVDNTIDTTTGTVKLRATFANPDETLFPNEFVNARLLVRELKGVLRVPAAAVQHGAPGTFVYRVTSDETVAVVPIKTGVTEGGYMEVTEGLAAGDKVVVDGTDRLREGAKVRVTPDPADPVADAAPPSSGPKAGQGGTEAQGSQHGASQAEPAAGQGDGAAPRRRHRRSGGTAESGGSGDGASGP